MADEQIDLTDVLDTKALLKEPTLEKARGATWVARGLVYIFGVAVLVSIVGGLILVGFHPPSNGTAGIKDNVVADAVIPLLQGVGSFAATVFSPLLAFVLGYYFGEKRQGTQ